MPRAHVKPDGARINALRSEADLTQQELAQAAGYGLRTIGKIEQGQATLAHTLADIADVLTERLCRPITLADLLHHPPANGKEEARPCEACTGKLTVMVRLPPASPARACKGLVCHDGAAAFTDACVQPTETERGQVLYWQLSAPRRGATYQLIWEW